MPTSKKTKNKKIKYRKIILKITARQKGMLERYCKVNKTSLKRLIKRSVREFLERNASNPADEYYISENQLRLFDEDEMETEVDNDVDTEGLEETKNQKYTGTLF